MIDRFMAKVQKSDSGCWIWTAYKDRKGYGKFIVNNKPELAHRVSWQIFRGEIPVGLEISHLCENPACVNPEHMEITTHKHNMRFGNNRIAEFARQTHCKNGHEFTEANTRIHKTGRYCKTCSRLWDLINRPNRKKAKVQS